VARHPRIGILARHRVAGLAAPARQDGERAVGEAAADQDLDRVGVEAQGERRQRRLRQADGEQHEEKEALAEVL
jgi:hypothetical protein